MAVDIDNVYQKVLALANKEQRGYITPQEFNLFADKAQKEIYNNYFHGIKMAETKPKNQMNYADEVEMLEEKLHPFHVDQTVSTSNATLTLPTTINKLISITRGNNEVTQVNKTQIAYTENNPLTKATLTRSVFVREDISEVTIFPAPSAATYNVDTDGNGSDDEEGFEISFYSVPSTPNWAYVLVGNTGFENALYNAGAATNFQLHSSEEENLVSRILMLAGVTIQKPEIQQAGVTDINLTRQQQNS
tara:strand:+ start:219 stop:962 length:744 start_codon:yes stop_codon:yes gene_type:complete